VALFFVRLLPRRTLSRTLGWLSERRLPWPLLAPVLWAYSKGFGVDRSEMARPLRRYRSFNDFFTRELRDGLRPQEPDPAAAVSPIDGRVYMSGTVERGTILQCKDVPYSIADLLGSDADAQPFEGGTFLTAYLSPKDYHRIHWPLDGRVERVRHLPGDLWPVNDGALAGVPRLFARNERVAIFGRAGRGVAAGAGAPFALVPVGALNVGSIRLAFETTEPLRTNRRGPRTPEELALRGEVATRKGDEAARFAFGSAIVLLLSREAGRLDPLEPGTVLRLGRRIGTLS